MKCPIFIRDDTRAQLGEETEIGDCIQAGCAWWDQTFQRCDPTGLIQLLRNISSISTEIHKELQRLNLER